MTGFGKRPDTIVHEQDPFNAEPARAALGAAPITPLDTFYARNHGPVPDLDPGSWRLRVGGLVERELELGLGELLGGRFERCEEVVTLQCAGNRRAGLIAVRDIPGEAPWGPGATATARWGGIALGDVLAAAGPRPQARHVAFVGADRSEEAKPPQLYGASIPLRKALRPEVMLASEMNGAPLVPVHGAPLRCVVPGYIGARSVKWLERIELRAEPWDGYFQSTAYRLLPPDGEPAPLAGMALGLVAVNADILIPDDGAQVEPGPVEVSGYAFAGGERHIGRVDVSADGGRTWRQAELLDDLGPWAWRLWRIEFDLASGANEIVVRAWDSAGGLQPERAESLWNPKGYVNNAWGRITVHARG